MADRKWSPIVKVVRANRFKISGQTNRSLEGIEYFLIRIMNEVECYGVIHVFVCMCCLMARSISPICLFA